MKSAAMPLVGGLVGTALAGPVGFLAGAKLATLGALAGSALGKNNNGAKVCFQSLWNNQIWHLLC